MKIPVILALITFLAQAATPDHAEHAGYLAATRTPEGTIHLISNALHYRFNLPWLYSPAPAE